MRDNPIRAVVVALFLCAPLLAKDAEFEWDGKFRTLVLYNGAEVTVKWVAKEDGQYIWEDMSGTVHKTDVVTTNGAKPYIIGIKGNVLAKQPKCVATVVCPCNGKTEKVEVKFK